MYIFSPEFKNEGPIPVRHTGFGADLSPELRLHNVPADTISLVLAMDDMNVPMRKEFNHWIIWNIPKTSIIPEGIPKGDVLYEPFEAIQGIAWGKHVYRGPKQPFFIRKVHRYRFSVYALNKNLDLSPDSVKEEVFRAMRGHVLAEAELYGTFDPKTIRR